MKETQTEKLLKVWVRKAIRDNRFYFPYEFISDGAIFIGYKAPTRFSEICLEYPEMVEARMDGKYRIGKLRLDNTADFLQKLPIKLKKVVQEELKAHGRPYQVYVQEAIFLPNRSVRIVKVKKDFQYDEKNQKTG